MQICYVSVHSVVDSEYNDHRRIAGGAWGAAAPQAVGDVGNF